MKKEHKENTMTLPTSHPHRCAVWREVVRGDGRPHLSAQELRKILLAAPGAQRDGAGDQA